MPDARLRQREDRQDLIESDPGERTLSRAPLQPLVPPPLGLEDQTAQTTAIASNTKVRVMPLEHPA